MKFKIDLRKIEKGLRLGITSLILARLLFSYGYEKRGYYAIGGEFFILPMLVMLRYLREALKETWRDLNER